jgi:membrane-associated tyrosine/threonine-specific cdc2-inhibitory kinase
MNFYCVCVIQACDVFSLGITILELACDLDLPSKGPLWTDLR